MKKKILLLILLLVPFMVRAEITIDNLYLRWSKEWNDNVDSYYEMPNTLLMFDAKQMRSVDRLTGEEKSITYKGAHLKNKDGNIMLINQKESNIEIIIYDEYLNELSKEIIENKLFDLITFYRDLDNNIILQAYDYDNYYYIADKKNISLYLINQKGHVIKSTSYNATQHLELATDKVNNNKFILIDNNNNIYDIDNFNIRPRYTNSDGTYMYLTTNKLYKKSSENEVVDSIDISGVNTRFTKKGNKYYIASTLYTNNSGQYYSRLKIYQVDEDLNIINTTETETFDRAFPYAINHHDRSLVGIFYDGNEVFYHVRYSTSTWCKAISEDLTFSDYDNYNLYGYVYSNTTLNGSALSGSYLDTVFGQEPEEEKAYQIKNKLISENTYYSKHIVIHDGTNYAVLLTQEKTNPDETRLAKEELIYYNSNLNEVYRRVIFDWTETSTLTRTAVDSDSERGISGLIIFYNDYVVVAATSKDVAVLRMYDNEGNIVKDMSDDISKYTTEVFTSLSLSQKGFLVEMKTSTGKTKGASLDLLNPMVLAEDEVVVSKKRILLYYSSNYIIKKKVLGEGEITSTVEEAEEGEVVRFTVTPKPGYVLGVIKVTDANGNVLTFTDYTFTMPSADVTIEATFLMANPKTGDIAILIICLIALSMLPIFAFEKRRLNALK